MYSVLARHEDALGLWETREARARAKKWGVTLSQAPEYWVSQGKPYTRYLSDHGLAFVKRAVRKARRAEIEWWAKFIVPILSLLVALASLLIRH